MNFVPSWPNMFVAFVVSTITLWYLNRNWDCFTERYRLVFVVTSVVEILVLLYVPPGLILVALATRVAKSDYERGDEEFIWDFPVPFLVLKPGSNVWHYINSMAALFFSGLVHLVSYSLQS